MSALIQSSSATLRTLQVSIQSLTVNNKQMTLAVFRQLPEIVIIDTEKGQLLPEVKLWGLVRYQIKDSGDVWVVCEKGGVLYRAQIPPAWDRRYHLIKCPVSYARHVGRFSDEMLKVHIDTCLNFASFIQDDGVGWKEKPAINLLMDDEKGLLFWFGRKPWNSFWSRPNLDEWGTYMASLKEFMGRYQPAVAEWKRQVDKMLADEKEIIENLNSVRTVLLGLPQLFIAV